MATEVQNPSDQNGAALVKGIVDDFQDLVKQQLRLTRQEIETELRKSKEPLSLLAIGSGLCLTAIIALCLTLAHLLHWLGAPAGTDPSHLPLWASYALVCGLSLIVGWILIMLAKNKMEAIGTPLQDTVQALKENIEWKTTTKPS